MASGKSISDHASQAVEVPRRLTADDAQRVMDETGVPFRCAPEELAADLTRVLRRHTFDCAQPEPFQRRMRAILKDAAQSEPPASDAAQTEDAAVREQTRTDEARARLDAEVARRRAADTRARTESLPDEWPEPREIESSGPAHQFPADDLPPLLRKAVREAQSIIQCPVPMVAVSAIAALSTAAQGLADVRRDAQLCCGPVRVLSACDSGIWGTQEHSRRLVLRRTSRLAARARRRDGPGGSAPPRGL